ncbi:MAG: hypothetical protein ABI855_10645, partial [Bacteroidota bacterium]
LGTDNAIAAERLAQHKSYNTNSLRIIYPNPAENFINLSYALGENDEANLELPPLLVQNALACLYDFSTIKSNFISPPHQKPKSSQKSCGLLKSC